MSRAETREFTIHIWTFLSAVPSSKATDFTRTGQPEVSISIPSMPGATGNNRGASDEPTVIVTVVIDAYFKYVLLHLLELYLSR